MKQATALNLFLAAIILACCAYSASAQTTQPTTRPSSATIKLAVVKEEGKKTIQATVTARGKPVENATVAFFVKRTFGDLSLGSDKTLDDGTAAVPFPEGLPGGTTGQLDVIARITAPEQYAASTISQTIGGGAIVPVEADPFPRALWAPHAPLPLILTIVVLLSGVWCTYSFVLAQLVKIRRAGKLAA